MSVWKSNFFMQTGLPEPAPKPPARDAAGVEQLADEQLQDKHRLPRRHGDRGKDKLQRKKRPPSLYNFYQSMRAIEVREANANAVLSRHQMQAEFRTLSHHQRAFWEYMLELYAVFEHQELAVDNTLDEETVTSCKKKLRHKFYFLEAREQQQLLRDFLADLCGKQNNDNLRHLLDIRSDLRLLLVRVDQALEPQQSPAAAVKLQADSPCLPLCPGTGMPPSPRRLSSPRGV